MLCLAATFSGSLLAADAAARPLLRAGLVTDLHYGDKPPAINRFYRETRGKLAETVAVFNEQKVDFVLQMGDLIDQADAVETEIGWLQEIEQVLAGLAMPRHYVLGNHCVGTLTKEEFRAHTGSGPVPHYAFQQAGVTFVVLDACFRTDGQPYARKNFEWTDANLPETQLRWLEAELAKAPGPVVVIAHQRLDEAGKHAVRNAAAARALLEKSGKVLGVFQGHSHKNDYQQIAGIHYTTLVAMVEGSGPENSGYGVLEVFSDGSMRVLGYRQQMNRELAARVGGRK